MNERIAALTREMTALEEELETELARRRIELNFVVQQGKIRFEQAIIARHRAAKTRLSRYVLQARPLMLLRAPIIYSLAVPLVLLDVFLKCCQAVCFPVYGIRKVSRPDYFIFDRGHLAYLNAIEKFNCVYCSYANGLIGYAREVASRTEQYWCPIKHARRVICAHQRYPRFVDYGDADAYRHELAALRQELQQPAVKADSH